MTFFDAKDWTPGLGSATTVETPQLLNLIGRRLRMNYDGVVGEPLPEKLATLVRQLDERPTGRERRGGRVSD
jgi:hypothetical protein